MSFVLSRPNPFDRPGRWLKGNLHLHTTNSDGKTTPADALAWHKANGYDFVCFGDHWKPTIPVDPEDKILVIPGCEIDTWTNETIGNTHVMCVGVDHTTDDFRPKHRKGLLELWNWAGELSDFRWIAHPLWSTQSAESLKQYQGLQVIEVYNHESERTVGMGDSEYVWQMLLNEGLKIDAVAVDDAHKGPETMGHGFIRVKATECTRAAIVAALKAGDFYATRGPVIESVTFDGVFASVKCSPAKRIIVRTNQFFGKVFNPVEGDSITEARFKIDLKEMDHVRFVIEDHQNLRAWSNPFFFANSTLKPKLRLESPVVGEQVPQTWNGL